MKLLFSSLLGIVGLFLLAFGCLFATGGGLVYYFTTYTSRDWVEVPGTVTTFESETTTESDGRTVTRFCPHVAYVTTSGEAYEVRINECSTPRAYDAGEAVTVAYNPAAPEQARLKGGIGETVGNIFAITFAVLGCVPMLLGAILCAGAVANAARRWRPAGTAGPAGPPAPVVM
jgi:hypothetical protein